MRNVSRLPLLVGSSPHVRGTPIVGKAPDLEGRFIPACAGNASMRPGGWGGAPVHPRMCGERWHRMYQNREFAGSSPHVRGTQQAIELAFSSVRFIPACAGNATARTADRQASPVHPRMCGERLFTLCVIESFIGSSPHVRGTRRAGHERDVQRRFIPACAGNAPRWSAYPARPSVHPRMCGERVADAGHPVYPVGSSPHVRGTHHEFLFRYLWVRFIPACAGNASAACASMRTDTVHPRMCGERDGSHMLGPRQRGSSPHVRGTPDGQLQTLIAKRFIPACAGNANGLERFRSRKPVHPRMCGERKISPSSPYADDGSSPHVRGTHFQ